MKVIFKSILFGICLLLILPLSAQFGEDWKFVKETDGIKVWSKPTPNSDFNQVLIKSEFDATLSTLVSIGRDVNSFPKWVYKNIGSRFVEKESDQTFIYHSVSDMPWPIEDRDAVIKYQVRQDPASKNVYISSQLVENHPFKKEKTVRAAAYDSQWVLTPTENGTVSVALRVIADPGGALPAWMANLFIDKGPIETFLSLRRLSKIEPYKSATFDFIVNQ